MTQQLTRSVVLVLFAAGYFVTPGSSAGAEPKAEKIRQQLLKLHNQERKATGLEPLTKNAELTKAAQ